MKLKNILGAVVFTSALLCATSVFAAEEEFKIGTPIDVDTNAEATELKAGQLVAYPVDIKARGQIVAYQLFMNYDNSVLKSGFVEGNITDDQYVCIDELGEIAAANDDGRTGAIFSIGEAGRRGFTAYGSYLGANTAVDADTCNVGWMDVVGRDVNADSPEFYVLFEVISDVSADELNKVLVTPYLNESSVGVYNVGSIPSDANTVKANACYGAFNINIDSSALPYWIQGLKVSVGDAEKVPVTEYKTTDNVNFTFPVRVVTNSNNVMVAVVQVYADTSSDEAGTKDVQNDVLMGTFSINLDKPATYVNKTVSAQQ